MTQKTPYELRYELLAMAQSILNERGINERIQIENDWNMKCEEIRFKAERLGTSMEFPPFPKISNYGVDYLIDIAGRLNDFVSKNS